MTWHLLFLGVISSWHLSCSSLHGREAPGHGASSQREVTTPPAPPGLVPVAKAGGADGIPACCAHSHPFSRWGCSLQELSQHSAVTWGHCSPWHTDLHQLLRVLVELLQDGQGLLGQAVLQDPLDHPAAVGVRGQSKHLGTKDRQQDSISPWESQKPAWECQLQAAPAATGSIHWDPRHIPSLPGEVSSFPTHEKQMVKPLDS